MALREWGWHENDSSDEFGAKRGWHCLIALVKGGLVSMISHFQGRDTPLHLCSV
jgi:hypothetical protein